MALINDRLSTFFPIETLKTAAPNFLSLPVALFCIPPILSAFGADGFGLLALIAVTSSFSHVCLLGLEKGFSRTLIKSKNIKSDLTLILCSAYVLSIAALGFFIFLYVMLTLMSFFLELSVSLNVVIIGLALSFINIIWHFQKSFLLAFEKFGFAAIFNFLHHSSYLFIPVCLLMLPGPEYDLVTVLLGLLGFRTLTVLPLVFMLLPTSFVSLNHIIKFVLTELHYAKWLGLAGNMYPIQSLLDRFTISILLGSVAHGYFALIIQLTQKIAIIPQALSTVIFIKHSKAITLGENNFDLISILFLISSIVFFVVDEYFFLFWLGEEFSRDLIALSPPCFIAMVFLSLNFIVTSRLEAEGIAKNAVRFEFFVVVLYAAVLPVICHLFGIFGAVYTLLVKEILAFVVKQSIAKHLIKFGYVSKLSLSCMLAALISVGLS